MDCTNTSDVPAIIPGTVNGSFILRNAWALDAPIFRAACSKSGFMDSIAVTSVRIISGSSIDITAAITAPSVYISLRASSIIPICINSLLTKPDLLKSPIQPIERITLPSIIGNTNAMTNADFFPPFVRAMVSATGYAQNRVIKVASNAILMVLHIIE